jgi:hypothetical protein
MSSPQTTPLTYNGYVAQIAQLAVYQVTTTSGITTPVDANFAAIISQMLNYAELRIQRDLDLQGLLTTNTYSITSGSNILQISANDFVTIQDLSVVVGSTPTPMLPTTKEFVMSVYGNPSFVGPPQYFAPYGGDSATFGTTYQYFILGPYPDQTYTINALGTVRAASLNSFGGSSGTAGTSTTLISTYFPDLLLMASMIYISGYQRNFGRQSDDPAMAVSYESQYEGLLKGATTEENRKKFLASAFTSMSSSPVATPGR